MATRRLKVPKQAPATIDSKPNGPSGAVLLSRSGKSACHVPAAA